MEEKRMPAGLLSLLPPDGRRRTGHGRSPSLEQKGQASIHERRSCRFPPDRPGNRLDPLPGERLPGRRPAIIHLLPAIAPSVDGSMRLEGIPGMEETRRAILEHHEFWNGSGYPYGLKGENISRPGRILSVAEFYDSIISERPHRGKLAPEEALQLVRNRQ